MCSVERLKFKTSLKLKEMIMFGIISYCTFVEKLQKYVESVPKEYPLM